MRPLYTTDEGGSVLISSDTWPSIGNTLGLTRAQIAEAKAARVQPTRKGGFAYMSGGPEDALFEIAGDYPAERFNHVHMWHEQPFCALLWYKKHLNAPVRQGFPDTDLNESDCRVARGDRTWPALNREGMFRTPRAGVEFGDVVLTWYMNQGDKPLAPSRGQMQDHIGLSVTDLDSWVGKLRGEGVTFLEEPYRFGETRAVMIEGPRRAPAVSPIGSHRASAAISRRSRSSSTGSAPKQWRGSKRMLPITRAMRWRCRPRSASSAYWGSAAASTTTRHSWRS